MDKFIAGIVRTLQSLIRLNQSVEYLLIDFISAAAPWLSPLIPASMTYNGMVNNLQFPVWVALAGAATVELVGLASVNTVYTFYEFNRTRRKVDSTAPAFVAGVTAVFYLSIVLTVNVLLDDSVWEAKLAKGLLSSLSICSGVVIALRAGHSRRLRGIEQEREERREERRMEKIARDEAPGLAKLATRREFEKNNKKYYRMLLEQGDPEACSNCGSVVKLSVDHIIPVLQGGTNDLDNLRILCMQCNSSKWGQSDEALGERSLMYHNALNGNGHKPIAKVCAYCGHGFNSVNKRTKYCSNSCKMKAFRLSHSDGETFGETFEEVDETLLSNDATFKRNGGSGHEERSTITD